MSEIIEIDQNSQILQKVLLVFAKIDYSILSRKFFSIINKKCSKIVKICDNETFLIFLKCFKFLISFHQYSSGLHHVIERILLFLDKMSNDEFSINIVIYFMNDLAIVNEGMFQTAVDLLTKDQFELILEKQNIFFYSNLVTKKSTSTFSAVFVRSLIEKATKKTDFWLTAKFQTCLIEFLRIPRFHVGFFFADMNSNFITHFTNYLIDLLQNNEIEFYQNFVRVVFILYQLLNQVKEKQIYFTAVYKDINSDHFLENIEKMIIVLLVKKKEVLQSQNFFMSSNSFELLSVSSQMLQILKNCCQIIENESIHAQNTLRFAFMIRLEMFLNNFLDREIDSGSEKTHLTINEIQITKPIGFNFNVFDQVSDDIVFLSQTPGFEIFKEFNVTVDELIEAICGFMDFGKIFKLLFFDESECLVEIRSKFDLDNALRLSIKKSDLNFEIIPVQIVIRRDEFGKIIRISMCKMRS